MGASMAGLLAAHALAKHLSRVTLIERDALPARVGTQRRGVPQGRHAHILTAAGLQTMEKLIPGLTDSLQADGALTPDVLGNWRYVLDGHRAMQTTLGVPALVAGRALTESHVRDRTRELGNASFLEGHEVNELILDASTHRITGVRASLRDDPSKQKLLEADLVIDATGRGARGLTWLKNAGLALPEEEKTTIHIVYATRHFRRGNSELGNDQVALITPTSEIRRGGAILAQEGGSWLVTLFGYLGEEPPTDLEGFKEYAGTLVAKDIAEMLADAEPLDEGTLIRFPASRRRHYELLEDHPDGYLVVGDALCSFNPIYGQGMTVAAFEAEALDACLRDRRGDPLFEGPRLAEEFYGRVTPFLHTAWATSTGGDLKYPEVDGVRTPEQEQANAFIRQVYQAASRDDEVSRQVVRLLNFLDRPDALQDPVFVERVQKSTV
ncbi:FAD-dependent monooxygenase [Streptomyces sp. NPDC050625]|uniref:NAD(P)/FAD-dependent oxidoreductase n=1 Tax=Streptomyces sp. NPDC050625 TaxID=3154629 RepID=UPI00342F512E